MAGKIFINYRRGDDAGFTQALYLRREDEFTADDLSMDVAGHIKPGDDFVEVLNAQVAACDVLLVAVPDVAGADERQVPAHAEVPAWRSHPNDLRSTCSNA